MLPTIPTINYVILKPDPNSFIFFREEFESFSELLDYVLEYIPDVSNSMRQEYFCGVSPRLRDDEQMFRDYAGDHIEQFLGENGYKLSRVVKG
jgi:hypothetical protein